MPSAEIAQWFEQLLFFEQLQHSAALATGDYQGVYFIQIGGGAHLNGLRSYSRQGFFVPFEIALQRQYADLFLGARGHYQPRVCSSSDSGNFWISRPNIATPRSSLASSNLAGSL